jgi:hypothetical protein
MTRRYWKIDDGAQLLVELDEPTKTYYFALSGDGTWADGVAMATDYVDSGERGAVQIQEPAARALAEKLGSSLDAMPALPA